MYIEYNKNPKGLKTGDCVVRAIATALNESWEDTYKGMLEVALKTYQAISWKNNFKKYLQNKGYEMHKMPKKENGKRYTVNEFCKEKAENNKTYIISLANHLTVVINRDLYDTWNCGNKSVGNYWELDTIKVPDLNETKKTKKRTGLA